MPLTSLLPNHQPIKPSNQQNIKPAKQQTNKPSNHQTMGLFMVLKCLYQNGVFIKISRLESLRRLKLSKEIEVGSMFCITRHSATSSPPPLSQAAKLALWPAIQLTPIATVPTVRLDILIIYPYYLPVAHLNYFKIQVCHIVKKWVPFVINWGLVSLKSKIKNHKTIKPWNHKTIKP